MLHILRNKRGQNTAEYAILIALVVAAAVAMQTYVKRGLQGRVKDGVDHLANETAALGPTGQYEPYYLESSYNVASDRTQREQFQEEGAVARTLEGTGEQTTRDAGGYQVYKAPQE